MFPIPGSMPAVMSAVSTVQITEAVATRPGGRDDWDYLAAVSEVDLWCSRSTSTPPPPSGHYLPLPFHTGPEPGHQLLLNLIPPHFSHQSQCLLQAMAAQNMEKLQILAVWADSVRPSFKDNNRQQYFKNRHIKK